ncbi:hypothetical protein GCM10009555_075200 [Acrocarpospora macrocephala]|uniref:Uncharacterized protein n=1 Tax=Acrocarpospora macrocephala TaxID=150177 RepID=A0A5M3X4B2_9ACTN|nr:hypothetical protein [Acrocarpospora macrocephala]GES14481.1 hypothetical protein Amac_080780 [Acrocarpospora macrocephala]
MTTPDQEQIRYALEHLAEHHAASGEIAKLRGLITPLWLDRKREHFGLDAYQSLSRDVSLALAHRPEGPGELPAFLRLCVLAATLNAIVTELPPQALTALTADGRGSQALASVAMITGRYEQARAFQAVARGQEPGQAAELWHRSATTAATLADDAQAGRLLAAAARGLTELGLPAGDLAGQAHARLSATSAQGASSWLLVTEAYTDLASADPEPHPRLDAALTALYSVDYELDDNDHALVEPLRALARALAASGRGDTLDMMIGQIASQDQRPPFSRYGRTLISLAVVAVGAAEGGEPERARTALDLAAGLGSGHRNVDRGLDLLLRERDFDDPTTWDSDHFTRVHRAGLLPDMRLRADEAAILAWADALVRPEADGVRRLAAKADRELDRLCDEEQRQVDHTRLGATRLDALNQREPLEPAILQEEQERGLLTRCYAAARLATALHHTGQDADRRFAEAITLTARLRAGHGGVVEVLLALAADLRAAPGETSKTITRIVDTARLDWARAVDTALDTAPDGTLDYAALVRRLAPARASAGDVTGLRLIAARTPAGHRHDPAKAELAYQLARAGDAEAARKLVAEIGRGRPRRGGVFRALGGALRYGIALADTHGMRRTWGSRRDSRRGLRDGLRYSRRREGHINAADDLRTWAALADTHRVLGSPSDGRRALRRALRTIAGLDSYLNPPKQVMPLLAAMIRPAVGLGETAILARVLHTMSGLGRPELMRDALADAVHDLNDLEADPPLGRRPLRLPDDARALLSQATLAAYDGRAHDPATLEDLGDVAAVVHAGGMLDREGGPQGRFRAFTALIRMGSPDAVDAALALIRSPELAAAPGALAELVAACVWTASGLDAAQVQALRELVAEQGAADPDTVAALIDLGLALPREAAGDVLADADRYAHRLRVDRPELLAGLARAGDDPVGLIARGAVAAVGTGASSVPGRLTSYLMAAAPAAQALDPGLPGRIWARIHDLRTFRTEERPAPVRASRRDVAAHILERVLITAFFYPVSLALTWVAVGLVAYLGGGERGPFWITAGVALIGAAAALRPARSVRQSSLNWFPFLGTTLGIAITAPIKFAQIALAVRLHPQGDTPLPRQAVPVLGALRLLSLTPGAWCLADGLVRHWIPPLSGVNVFAVFGIMTATAALNVAWSSLRLWSGSELPY